jgi:hypothetical protein
LRIEENYQHVLDAGLWNFSIFGRGDVLPTHSEFCRFVSVSQAKHQVSSPVIILFKKFLSASAIAIISGQDVTHLPFAQVSRSVEQNGHTTFSFPNYFSESEGTTVFGMLKDSDINVDAI